MSSECSVAASCSIAFWVSGASPNRARWALSRQSVAARTCASLAGTGRSQEPAQPSTSGFAAAASPGPPQPASATTAKRQSSGPHPKGIDTRGRA